MQEALGGGGGAGAGFYGNLGMGPTYILDFTGGSSGSSGDGAAGASPDANTQLGLATGTSGAAYGFLNGVTHFPPIEVYCHDSWLLLCGRPLNSGDLRFIPYTGLGQNEGGGGEGRGQKSANDNKNKPQGNQQTHDFYSICELAHSTEAEVNLGDLAGTGFAGIDAGGRAISTLAPGLGGDIKAGAALIGQTASRVAGPAGLVVGFAQAGTNFLTGDTSSGIYSSIDVAVGLGLASTGPVGVGAAFLFSAAGGSKAAVHAAASAACKLGY